MEWINDYQLFLFDFDGLLVNTEEIHYLAYKKMCADRGYELPWDFARYCQAAHYDQEKLRKSLVEALPELTESEEWEVLYAEKKQAVLHLLSAGAVHLMPGAEELLLNLEKKGVQRCVVTHSPDEQIQIIRQQNSILNTIPHWFTRESYTHPKPHPECYLNAIKKLGKRGGHVIGFEDTPRGVRALLKTPAKTVFISQVNYPELPEFLREGAVHFPTLLSLQDNPP